MGPGDAMGIRTSSLFALSPDSWPHTSGDSPHVEGSHQPNHILPVLGELEFRDL